MEKRSTRLHRAEPASSAKTILLAEDDSLVRELVHAYLEDHGYQLIVAESGQAALAASEKYAGRIDLLLSDYQMPNMDGLTLAEQISESRPGTKTLLMSGYTGDPTRFSQGTRSIPAFIQKPFMPLDLLERIERLTA
jgi:CheY-like chemotaxis protein